MTAAAKPTVHEAIGKIISEMEGVGKDRENKEQHYKFRGIDDVLKAIHPLLGKHGVFIVPHVVDRETEERTAKSGAKGYCTYLHVEYTIYGPAGDSFTASTWGEGLDYGDKSTNKAMTAAFKYLLFEVFAVCDPDDDGDHDTPDAGERTPRQTRTRSAPGGRTRDPADLVDPDRPDSLTKPQLGKMNALFVQKGFPDDRTVKLSYVNEIVKREEPVTSSTQLTNPEASKVIDALLAEEDAPPLEVPDNLDGIGGDGLGE